MNVSAASSVNTQAFAQRAAAARPPVAAQPVDSDGDHDGSTAANGHIDVKV